MHRFDQPKIDLLKEHGNRGLHASRQDLSQTEGVTDVRVR
jgi:hypothetical protein